MRVSRTVGFKGALRSVGLPIVAVVSGSLCAVGDLEAAPAPPAAAAPAAAELALDTEPPGARVFIDGRDEGVTPLVVKVTDGAHGVVFTLPGYQPRGVNVDVSATKRASLQISLDRGDGDPTSLPAPARKGDATGVGGAAGFRDPFADPDATKVDSTAPDATSSTAEGDEERALELELGEEAKAQARAKAQKARQAPSETNAWAPTPRPPHEDDAAASQRPARRASRSERSSDWKRSIGTMNGTLSGLVAVGYGYGFGTGYGLGARIQLTNGADSNREAREEAHSEFGVELGLDYVHVGYSHDDQVLAVGPTGQLMTQTVTTSWSYSELTPLVGLTWNYWFDGRFAVYPKLDLGYRVQSWSSNLGLSDRSGLHGSVGSVYFQGTAGIVIRRRAVSFRAEGGWSALHVGLGVSL